MTGHPLQGLIDRRIEDAMAAGDFDNLPGAGAPLPKCDDPETALLNRLMEENGAEPEFVSLSRELRRLRRELAATGEPTRRRDIMTEMSMTEARIALARKNWRR